MSIVTQRFLGNSSRLLRQRFSNMSYARFPIVQGHRGAPFLEPENTLSGFETAAKVGANSVELDVFLSTDGIPVVFHGGAASKELQEKMKQLHPDSDPKDFLVGELSTLTKTVGNIQDLSIEEIKSLKLNPNGYDCPPERLMQPKAFIPTLEQALLLCRSNNLHVTIELKGADTPYPVVQLLKKLGMVGEVTISSFTWSMVEAAKKLEPKLSVALLFDKVHSDAIECALKLNATEVHFRYDTVTKELVARAHEHGLIAMAWFRSPHDMKNEALEFHKLIQTGVDVICTNRPDQLAELKATLLPRL